VAFSATFCTNASGRLDRAREGRQPLRNLRRHDDAFQNIINCMKSCFTPIPLEETFFTCTGSFLQMKLRPFRGFLVPRTEFQCKNMKYHDAVEVEILLKNKICVFDSRARGTLFVSLFGRWFWRRRRTHTFSTHFPPTARVATFFL
jgi:hypothetical protein